MGTNQSRRHQRSLSRFAKQMSIKQRNCFQKHIIPRGLSASESWRMALINLLTNIELPPTYGLWVPLILDAVYQWDASLDLRWQENVKWFLISRDRLPTSFSSSVHCRWTIPQVSNHNIFASSSMSEFLEEHLKQERSHGIAFLIGVFTKFFLSTHQPQSHIPGETAIIMKSEIVEFSKAATKAFTLYYGNIDVLGLLEKPESFLTLMVRNCILENESVLSIYLDAISMDRKHKETLYQSKLMEFGDWSLTRISSETRPELIEVADSVTGFQSPIAILSALVEANSLKEKIDLVYRLSVATVKAFDVARNGEEVVSLMADDMMVLFIYFILHAKVPLLGSHIEMLNGLVHYDQMDNITGYCLATLEGALLYIESQLA